MKYVNTTLSPNITIDHNRLSTPSIEILVGIDVLFFLLCIAGNLFVLILAIRTKSLHTPSFLFVLSVVVGHLLVGFVILPMFIVSHFPEKYMSTPICKVIAFLTRIASNGSLASLFPLTFDSFRKNSQYKRKQNLTYSNAVIHVACAWIFAIAYALFFPIAYEMVDRIHPYPVNPSKFWSTSMCEVSESYARAHKIFTLADLIILYIIPVVVLGSMNLQIFWWQWKGSTETGQEVDKTARNAVTKAGAIFLLVFIFCNIGNYTILMYIGWGPGHFWDVHLWLAVAALIGYAQSWLNVVLLFLFNKPFRQAILNHKVSGKDEEKKDMSEMKQLKDEKETDAAGIRIKVEDCSA